MKYVQGPMTTAIIAPSQTMDSLCLLSLSSPLAPTQRLEWLLVCSRWWDKLCVSSIYLLLCFHEAFFIPDEIILIVGISFHLTSNSLCTEIRRMSTSHFVCYFVFFFLLHTNNKFPLFFTTICFCSYYFTETYWAKAHVCFNNVTF